MMKKFLVFLVLGSLLMLMAMPALAQEEIPEKCRMRREAHLKDAAKNLACPLPPNEAEYTKEYCNRAECVPPTQGVSGALCCLFSTVYFATDWVFTVLMILVMVFVLWGAFELLTAAGNVDKVTAGRDKIMYAAIGLAVALIARAVPAIVRYLIAPGA